MKIEISDAARFDLEKGIDYYGEIGGKSLANRFLNDVEHCLDLIAEHNEIGAGWVAKSKRLPLRHKASSIVSSRPTCWCWRWPIIAVIRPRRRAE